VLAAALTGIELQDGLRDVPALTGGRGWAGDASAASGKPLGDPPPDPPQQMAAAAIEAR
jgi:hypothetical protein